MRTREWSIFAQSRCSLTNCSRVSCSLTFVNVCRCVHGRLVSTTPRRRTCKHCRFFLGKNDFPANRLRRRRRSNYTRDHIITYNTVESDFTVNSKQILFYIYIYFFILPAYLLFWLLLSIVPWNYCSVFWYLKIIGYHQRVRNKRLDAIKYISTIAHCVPYKKLH